MIGLKTKFNEIKFYFLHRSHLNLCHQRKWTPFNSPTLSTFINKCNFMKVFCYNSKKCWDNMKQYLLIYLIYLKSGENNLSKLLSKGFKHYKVIQTTNKKCMNSLDTKIAVIIQGCVPKFKSSFFNF